MARLIHTAALLTMLASLAFAQGGGGRTPPPPNPPAPLPRPDASDFDKDRLLMESETRKTEAQYGGEETCLFPPLNSVPTRTVTVANLQLSGKAKKEYQAACGALRDKKYDSAESHLRKAVQQSEKYAPAWVTLGQMLAAQQHSDEAQDACTRATAADANYVPSYLCLADIAARSQKWDEALKLSGRAIELDPTSDPIAYDYNACAYLGLHKLPEAEKSALRAIAIDKTNTDPRVHFLLAQIYDAKRDLPNEAAQLREYLKFAIDANDAAMVKQYLADLEKKLGK